jgi:hypothetical protein
MKLKNDQLTGAVGDFVRMVALGHNDADELQRLACDLLGVPQPARQPEPIPEGPVGTLMLAQIAGVGDCESFG